MRTERFLVVSVVLLSIGIIWLAANWNGTISFNAAYPTSSSLFVFNIINKGASALFGVMFTVLGLVSLMVTFIVAIFQVTARKPS
jgi:uncharacterized membrane protein